MHKMLDLITNYYDDGPLSYTLGPFSNGPNMMCCVTLWDTHMEQQTNHNNFVTPRGSFSESKAAQRIMKRQHITNGIEAHKNSMNDTNIAQHSMRTSNQALSPSWKSCKQRPREPDIRTPFISTRPPDVVTVCNE